MSYEEYVRPRVVAVRFPNPESEKLGAKVLLTQTTEGVGLRGGIHIIWEKDAELLDKAFSKYNLRYDKYYPKSNEASEIYEYFGTEKTEKKAEHKGLLRKLLNIWRRK